MQEKSIDISRLHKSLEHPDALEGANLAAKSAGYLSSRLDRVEAATAGADPLLFYCQISYCHQQIFDAIHRPSGKRSPASSNELCVPPYASSTTGAERIGWKMAGPENDGHTDA
jgi:hypothetical protein